MSNTSAPSDLGVWSMLTTELPVGKALFRVRTDKPTDPQIDKFVTAIVIRWEYDSESGFPDPPERQAMDTFEDAIAELTGGEHGAYLMLVTTGFSVKEWVFYVKDPSVFMDQFNDSLADEPRYPLDITFVEDAKWAYWLDVQGNCLSGTEDN